MKKVLLLCAVALGLAVLATGCGGGGSTATQTQAPATTAAETEAPATTEATGTDGAETVAAECGPESLNLVHPGQLTVGTGNPAYSPWFGGGESGNEFKYNDPYSGQGFESAVVYAVAKALGFTPEQVKWVTTTFNQSIAPGPKKYDFNIQQIGITKKRAKAVLFSEGYYDNVQALVSVKGSKIAGAKTFADLQGAKLGVPIGTTSYDYVVDNLGLEPVVFDDQAGAVQALKNGQVDGIVTDLYTGFIVRDVELDDGVIVGQFPTIGETEQFGMTLAKDNPLVDCLNTAIEAIKSDGTLDQITQKWLASKGNAPVITQ